MNVKIKQGGCGVKKVVQIFNACMILYKLLLSEPEIPSEWYEVWEEDIGIDVESDILFGTDVCGGIKDRREHVKHTLIELYKTAPL